MKKALVTGANGFVGSRLVSELLNHEIEVIAADLEGHRDKIPEQVRFVPFDMRNFSELGNIVSDRDIDVMFHLAWIGSSGLARANYMLQLDNVRYNCDAVKVAAEMNIKRFVGAGSLAQYDCMAYVGKNGSTPNPVSIYGSSKIASQYISKAIANDVGIEHIWCILSNIYGIGDTTSNFINFTLNKMLSGERASFTLGEQNYDFVYITDIINGLYLCGEFGKQNNSYYIGSGKPKKLKEYIKTIRDTVDPEIPIYFGEIPYNGISLPLESYDCSLTEKDTGFKAEISFSEGIKKTMQWLKERNRDTKI